MSSPSSSENLLSSKQLAEILAASRTTVYRYAAKGMFDAKKVNEEWRFDKKLVKKYLEESAYGKDTNIPLSIDQFRFQYSREPSCFAQSPFLKLSKNEFTEEDINQIASSFVRYLYDRNLSYHTRSWQDFVLQQTAMHAAFVKLISRRILEKEEPPILAQLKVFYRNFPDIKLSEEQLFELDLWRNDSKREKEDISMEDIARKVMEVASCSEKNMTLTPRGLQTEAEKIRKSILKLDKERLVRIAEGVVAGLIGSGLLELLAWALKNVPMAFAPYAEAQVYEIEGVLHRKAETLSKEIDPLLEAEDIPDEERLILRAYFVHAFVLMGFYGREIGSNPLMKQAMNENH